MTHLDLNVQLPADEALQELERMAKDHPDQDIRTLAGSVAGFGRCLVSLFDALNALPAFADPSEP